MIIKKITDYYSVIEQCYSEDPDLLSKYHILAPNNPENCAKDSFDVLQKDEVEFFGAFEENNLIGYFAKLITPDYKILSTIFVRPKYRKSKFMSEFWENINKIFEHRMFISGIYQKNTRCAKFFRKFAVKEKNIEIEGKNITIFVF